MYAILDARGLVLQHLHSGRDPDAARDSLTGRPVNSAGHALANLTTDVLLPLLRDTCRLKQIIAVWDGGNFFREQLSGGTYKALRKAREASPELHDAVNNATALAQDLFKRLGITQVTVPTVEADDVIAWMVERLPCSLLIYTVDRDLLALSTPKDVEGRVVAVNVRRDWPEAFRDKDVVVPYRWITLYKSLVGDTADNYGGVTGFGPKAWTKLVETYGEDGLARLEQAISGESMATLRTWVEDAPGQHPLLEKLHAQFSEWSLGYKLARLHPELIGSKQTRGDKPKFLLPKWTVRVPDPAKVYALLSASGNAHLYQDLEPYLPKQILITAEGTDVDAVLADAKQLISESPFIALDWETWAPEHEPFRQAAKGREYVDMLSSRLTGVGLTMGRNQEYTFYLSVGHADTANLQPNLIPQILELIPDHIPKVAHNAYFELSVYKAQFGNTLTNCHDTKIMASHVEEAESAGLKDLSLRILGYNQIKYRDVIAKGKTMADYSAEHVFAYGADDPLVTAHLYEFLKLQLLLEGTWEFVRDNEFPAVYPLVDAYLRGVELDWTELSRVQREDQEVYETNMARLRELLREHVTSEQIVKGTENLMSFEREIIDAQHAAGQLSDEQKALLIAKLYDTLEERVTYRDRVGVPRELDIKLTPRTLGEAALNLGLPDWPRNEKGERKAMSRRSYNEWLGELLLAKTPETRKFVDLILDNQDSLPYVTGKATPLPPEGRRLLRWLQQHQLARLPEEQRMVWTGTELSLSSPKQMQALLYGMLAIKPRLRAFDPTDLRVELNLDGAVQANEAAIRTAMAWDAPEGTWEREALECLLAAKKADTRRKNFYVTYPLWRHPVDGRVHAQINSVGTETRRMSGSAPNLMQLPKKGDGVKFRCCFLPHKGHDVIISIDFAGEELRVAAGLSRDPAMLGCYIDAAILRELSPEVLQALGPELVAQFETAELRDLHSQTAAEIAKMSYEEFQEKLHTDGPDQSRLKGIRGVAKTVNFGSQYGIGPTKLSRQLICDLETAKQYLEAKKKAYKRFEEWREERITELHRQGYLRTLYGTYRHVFNKLLTADEGMRGYLERAALNFLIQGLCADYLKVVLRTIHETRILERYGVDLIAPIHDELVFSCAAAHAPGFICEVHELMIQGIPGLPCPIWAEPSLGPNFGHQVEIGPWPTPDLVRQALDKALSQSP
jgi:DNA polymerase I-like protein with 3'-5' exonuclease and polymerase domains/5'-3' exonuclease